MRRLGLGTLKMQTGWDTGIPKMRTIWDTGTLIMRTKMLGHRDTKNADFLFEVFYSRLFFQFGTPKIRNN